LEPVTTTVKASMT